MEAALEGGNIPGSVTTTHTKRGAGAGPSDWTGEPPVSCQVRSQLPKRKG